MFMQQSLQPKRHVATMLVFRMLCRITQFSKVHRTESVSMMGHELTMGVSSKRLVQKQQNIFGRISLFWSVTPNSICTKCD